VPIFSTFFITTNSLFLLFLLFHIFDSLRNACVLLHDVHVLIRACCVLLLSQFYVLHAYCTLLSQFDVLLHIWYALLLFQLDVLLSCFTSSIWNIWAKLNSLPVELLRFFKEISIFILCLSLEVIGLVKFIVVSWFS